VNATFKTAVLWLSLLVVIVLAWHFAPMNQKEVTLKFTEFMDKVDAGQVEEVTLTGYDVKGKLTNHEPFRSVIPSGVLGYEKLIDKLVAKKVQITVQPDQTPAWASALFT
jgi:cell division protease FtsH